MPAKRPAPEYTLVETDSQLREVCEKIKAADRIAVDTEFVGEKYYYPKLEVLQLGDGESIAVIDIRAIKDLGPVAELLGDESRLKLFHAAGQDLEILQRNLGTKTLPVFDTQIAASMLGFGAQISLSNLINALCQETVGGKHSTSDWGHRPLSEAQLAYAATDVEFLHRMHDELKKRLEQRDRYSWFVEEQHERVDAVLDAPEVDRDEFHRRIKDWMSLSPQEMAILRILALWREDTARERDMPRRQVFTDEGLVEITRFLPRSRDAMKKLRRVNLGQAFRWYDDLQRCMKEGLAVPKEDWPRKPKSNRPNIPTGLVEICQALLRTEAERQDIAASVIATTSELQYVIANREELNDSDHSLLHGWRRALVGQKLVDLLEGRLRLGVGAEGELILE